MKKAFNKTLRKALQPTGLMLYVVGGILMALGVLSMFPVGIDGFLSILLCGTSEGFSSMFYEGMGSNAAVLGEYANAVMRFVLFAGTFLAGAVLCGLGRLCRTKGCE